MGCTEGNRYGAASNAVAAAITENSSDDGISDSVLATKAQTSSEIDSAHGQFKRCATWA
ncbi:hypothetical protein D3C75_1302880 [compost metagenome]